MRARALTRLSDDALAHELAVEVSRERGCTAVVVAYIAEFDARRLYLKAGCPSMHEYCVTVLRLSEDAAYKRIQAARAALRFPVVLAMLADGRLNLSTVVRLAPHLTEGNAKGLLGAAAGKTKGEVERLLAERFPRPETFPMVQVVAASKLHDGQLVPEPVGTCTAAVAASGGTPTHLLASEHAVPPPSVKPHAAGRFTVQFSMGQGMHDKLRQAQALLGHQIPSGDLAAVFARALDALIGQLEKRKCAATARPRRSPRASANTRHVPAHVKRAVWERDQGRCTFVSETGRRCAARRFLELDHAEPVARGGRSTVDNVRLRCRGHNQFEAERAFGADFMSAKRAAAQRARGDASRARVRVAEDSQAAGARRPAVERARGQAEEERAHAVDDTRSQEVEAQARASEKAAQQQTQDLLSCLTTLGFRSGEARRAAECCPGTGLEERVRAALRFLCPRARVVGRVGAVLGAG